MNLILRVKTQSPDIRFSFLRIKLVSGKIVVLTWADSNIGRSKEGFQAVTGESVLTRKMPTIELMS